MATRSGDPLPIRRREQDRVVAKAGIHQHLPGPTASPKSDFSRLLLNLKAGVGLLGEAAAFLNPHGRLLDGAAAG